MNARAAILARIKTALADVTEPDPSLDVPVTWSYGRPVLLDGKLLAVFQERVEDYGAVVTRASAEEVGAAIVEHLRATETQSIAVPTGIDPAWCVALEAAGLELRGDEPPLSHHRLDETDAVVTASAVGVADTGTIVLDHRPDQGRRALTLVPDRHVCVIRADQVVSSVAEAVVRLKDAVLAGRPLTWISGGSATSDIELSRVEGVHGPRHLHVVLVTDLGTPRETDK